MATKKKEGSGKNQYVKAREEGREWKISEEIREKLREAGRGRVHSEETRAKISASRKTFLQENPHMVPYRLNHYSKGESYPEAYFRGVLESAGVLFKQEHQVGLYSLDFAVPDRMIDLEIDGEQHYVNTSSVERDRKRNEHLQGLGWNVIRVRWSSYQALSEAEKRSFCEDLVKKLK
jgi:very-short-patch-repair endonuclease